MTSCVARLQGAAARSPCFLDTLSGYNPDWAEVCSGSCCCDLRHGAHAERWLGHSGTWEQHQCGSRKGGRRVLFVFVCDKGNASRAEPVSTALSGRWVRGLPSVVQRTATEHRGARRGDGDIWRQAAARGEPRCSAILTPLVCNLLSLPPLKASRPADLEGRRVGWHPVPRVSEGEGREGGCHARLHDGVAVLPVRLLRRTV